MGAIIADGLERVAAAAIAGGHDALPTGSEHAATVLGAIPRPMVE
ncbi:MULTISPECIES: hypothetical protein [unclassified Nocardia]